MYGSPFRWIRCACFALVAAACGRSDVPVPTRRVRAYPGALTKPIDAYSGDELYDLTRGLEYAGSHARERRCRNAVGCEGTSSTRRTLVELSAVATQDSLGAGSVPPFGVVAIQAINRGDVEEAGYGMRAGSTLRYYAIVQRDSTGALRWRLEELDTAAPRRHVQIAAGRVHGCGHAWTAGARADFRSCASAARPDSGVTPPLLLQAALDDPLWFECDMGCCTLVR